MDEMQGIKIYPDAGHLAHATADHFVVLAGEAIASHGRFAVALAGGSTPKAAYALLATREYATRVDWSRVHIFWGDERCVPPDHANSNYRMAREALLDHVPIPTQNVHRMMGELEPVQAASEYQAALGDFFSSASINREKRDETRPPRFDLVLLGMGDDGHTASLFPGTAEIHEQTHWVLAHYVEKLGAWRITLTPVVINAAANVAFVVSGSGKAERLRQVLNDPPQPDILPAQIVNPASGRLHWLLDQTAASSLPNEDL